MNRTWKFVLIASLVGNLTIVYVAAKALEYRNHINHFLDLYTKVVSEFSERQVYAAANSSLPPKIEGRPRVVFLGTQVTERWKVEEDFPECQAINRGVDGQRFAGFLLRFRSDVIDLKPDAVIIEISSYNFRPESSLEEFREYTLSLVDLARSNGIVPIIGTVIPPVAGTPDPEGYALRDSLRLFNDWLQEESVVHSYQVVDFASILSDSGGHLRNDLAAEAIDPNDAGYAVMTSATQKILNKGFGSEKSADQ